ncbi:dynein light chain Tctex-type 5-like [Kogia breviceps]|uniref:dynein light chain Tctex-type 5-like n=1 Tax=Kogia breviceps TaxID=27615 RepID=UPI0034D27ECA
MGWPEVKFLWVQVQELMQAHLPNKLTGVTYHPALCAHLAAVPSAEIQDLVKTVSLPCYRLVYSVSLGSKGQDGVVVSSGCLWDPHADSFAISHYVNPMLLCMAVVHAIYLE